MERRLVPADKRLKNGRKGRWYRSEPPLGGMADQHFGMQRQVTTPRGRWSLDRESSFSKGA